jgi:DNA-3-methyladenine glycosylase
MSKVLTKNFFKRHTLQVAEELLGKSLIRKYKGKIIKDIIVEVEAYHGKNDRASHAFKGLTKKTEPMFKEGGIWFVYLTYGMHWMLNVVTEEKNFPGAVLIRSVKSMKGPGRVSKFFHIDKKFNGLIIAPSSKLWIEESNIKVVKKDIKRSARIGVDYAGEYWKKRKWNFSITL